MPASIFASPHDPRSGRLRGGRKVSFWRASLLGATALVGAALLARPAQAEPATEQGARQIEDVLARYVGRTVFDKGLVTITPSGDGYTLDLDLDSARLGLPADAPHVRFGPVRVQLTPKDDGTYATTWNAPSLAFAFEGGESGVGASFDERMEGCTGDGVLDPRLGTWTGYTATCGRQTLTAHTPIEDIDATLGKISIRGDARAGTGDTVDAHLTADLADLVETVTVKNPARPAAPVVMRAGNMHEDVAIRGLENAKLLDLLAFTVGKGTPAGIAAAQGDIKSKLLAALPLWQDVSADVAINDFSMGTPVGIVRAASVEEKIGVTGATGNAGYNVGLTLSGLALPDGLVPDWAGPFVPSSGRFDFDLTSIDLDGLVRQVIQNFDATKTPPVPDSLHATLMGLFAAGHPRLHFEGGLKAASLDVTAQGDTSVVPSQQGKATISASGLDGLVTALNKADLPNKQRALLGLAFAKGLSKPGPDGRSVWEIEFDSIARKIVVNGQSFGRRTKP